jgi:hypothetical protein
LFFGKRHARTVGSARAACKPDGERLSSGMVNPFAISWLWRGFKGKSVTFALLFACFLFGWTVTGSVFVLLRKSGVHWLFALIATVMLFSFLAKQEDRVIPDEGKRKLYARGLIVLSIVVALLIAWLKPKSG